MSEKQWIASSRVVFVERDGTRHVGRVGISLPVADQNDAACSYTLEPIVKERPIYGVDTLQALLLAIRTCAAELAMFEKRGGHVEWPPQDDDGTPGPRWDPSITFGPLFRMPGD